MGFLQRFHPDYCYKCVGDIEGEFFKKNNIKYVILDIDNTLVPYTVKSPDDSALRFLEMLEEEGIYYGFLSNNNKRRVQRFNEDVDTVFVSNAKKPLLFGIKKLMEKMGAEKENTVMIGDQVFTDVWVGRRIGILTILVDPIEDKESLFFKCKRSLEKKVLKRMGK